MVKLRLLLGALIVAQAMQTTIAEDDVVVAAGSVAPIRSILDVLCSVNVRFHSVSLFYVEISALSRCF